VKRVGPVLPNFFIPGAPKCGTTALYHYLREHPEVYMASPKEPNYFASDLRSGRSMSGRRYARLFAHAEPSHRRVGEASTSYLLSEKAIPEIEAALPAPNYIVCARNPIELAESLHRQQLFQGIEDVPCFREAWRLQEARRRGGAPVPRRCPNVRLLLYGDSARVGRQIERMLEYVERERLLVVLLEDLRDDPRGEYRRILRFLDLPDDGREDFPVVNPAGARRFPAIHAWVRRAVAAKNTVGLGYFGERWNALYDRLTARPAQRSTLDPALSQEMADFFADDVERLERITGRALREQYLG